jgi:hypothetical protein
MGHKGHLSSNHHSLERSSAASNGSWTFSILTWLGWFSPLYEFVSLDFQCAEGRYKQEPADKTITAEQLFDARWALTLLSRAMNLLHQEYVLQGRASTFQILKIFLQSSDTPPSYEAAARALALDSEQPKRSFTAFVSNTRRFCEKRLLVPCLIQGR